MTVDPADAALAVVPDVPGSPSWLTGEFYAALAPLAAGLITLLTGRHVVPAEAQDWLVGAGTIVAGTYAVARTVLKATHVHAAAAVARAAAISQAQAAAARPAGPGLSDTDLARIADAVTSRIAAAALPVRKGR